MLESGFRCLAGSDVMVKDVHMLQHLQSTVLGSSGLCELKLLLCDVLADISLVLQLELTDLLLQVCDVLLMLITCLLGLLQYCVLLLLQLNKLCGMPLLYQGTCE